MVGYHPSQLLFLGDICSAKQHWSVQSKGLNKGLKNLAAHMNFHVPIVYMWSHSISYLFTFCVTNIFM